MSIGLFSTIAVVLLFANTIMVEALITFLPSVQVLTLSAKNQPKNVLRRAMKDCYITPGKGPPVV